MPEIINHFKQFITSLETFNFPPVPQDVPISPLIIQQKQDQETLTNLLTLLKMIVKDRVEDLDISHADLLTVQNHCKPCSNKQLDLLVSENIKIFCITALQERNALFSNVYGFIFNCKIVTSMSLIDFTKVGPDIIAVCKMLFKTDNPKSFIESKEIGVLLGLLQNEFLFSKQLMFTHVTHLQKEYEDKLVAISKAREGISPTRFQGGDFTITPFFRDKFANLRKYGRDPFTASSAPNSPTAKQVPSPKGPSSLPSSPHKPLDDASITNAPPPPPNSRVRSSSLLVPPLRFSSNAASTTSSDPLSEAFRQLNLVQSIKALEDDDLEDKEEEDDVKRLDAPRNHQSGHRPAKR